MIDLPDSRVVIYSGSVRIPPDNHLVLVDSTVRVQADAPQVRSFPTVIETLGTSVNLTSDSPSVTVGRLPKGLQFMDNEDGTAFIYGTPAAKTRGEYVLSLVADNQIPPSQEHTLRIVID